MHGSHFVCGEADLYFSLQPAAGLAALRFLLHEFVSSDMLSIRRPPDTASHCFFITRY